MLLGFIVGNSGWALTESSHDDMYFVEVQDGETVRELEIHYRIAPQPELWCMLPERYVEVIKREDGEEARLITRGRDLSEQVLKYVHTKRVSASKE
jgi:hypothetical protein